ncbi:MAG: formate dehydrogenase accessory sulfurtransferase FdhD [Vicinamibacterales bacterium]
MTPGSARVPVLQVRDRVSTQAVDAVATESPLEVRIDGRTYAVLMRTPGQDRPLAAGFLLSERLIRSVDDIATLEHCTDPDASTAVTAPDTVSVVLTPDAAARAAALTGERREVLATAACGVCGRATLASMHDGLAPLRGGPAIPASLLTALPARLRVSQPLFEQTGGTHAAAVFDAAGAVVAAAEDVGRHNAVDKVTGTLLLREMLPGAALLLCVSGRTAFEIVQKAWCAGIPVVVSVSAPTSLAVRLAEDAGITLAGFVRGTGLNIYTHPSRIAVA